MDTLHHTVGSRVVSGGNDVGNIEEGGEGGPEVNFGPQSELMWEGTPKRVIQAVKRAVAQAEAVVSSKGTASTQQVEWSMMVKM